MRSPLRCEPRLHKWGVLSIPPVIADATQVDILPCVSVHDLGDRQILLTPSTEGVRISRRKNFAQVALQLTLSSMGYDVHIRNQGVVPVQVLARPDGRPGALVRLLTEDEINGNADCV